MKDYNQYRYSFREYVLYSLQGFLISFILLYLFYRSMAVAVPAGGFVIIFLKRKRKKKIKEQQWQLNLEFKEGITSLSNALYAGYSIENAFLEAARDLTMLYGEEAFIIKEFQYISNQLRMNRTVEECLKEFALRSGVEDIGNFAEVFVTAKRTGGDIMGIIRNSSQNVAGRIEVKREIQTIITAKQMESRIMCLVPFGIILYLWVFSPGFLDGMYGNLRGILIMSVLLLVYLGAYVLSEKIVDIKV